jgi:hypothetical protein
LRRHHHRFRFGGCDSAGSIAYSPWQLLVTSPATQFVIFRQLLLNSRELPGTLPFNQYFRCIRPIGESTAGALKWRALIPGGMFAGRSVFAGPNGTACDGFFR